MEIPSGQNRLRIRENQRVIGDRVGLLVRTCAVCHGYLVDQCLAVRASAHRSLECQRCRTADQLLDLEIGADCRRRACSIEEIRGTDRAGRIFDTDSERNATSVGDAAAGKTNSVACGACHGADGNSASPFPKLAGQGEKYLLKRAAGDLVPEEIVRQIGWTADGRIVRVHDRIQGNGTHQVCLGINVARQSCKNRKMTINTNAAAINRVS